MNRRLLLLLLALFLATPTWAQIAFDAQSTIAAESTADNGSWSHNNVAGSVLVCGLTSWTDAGVQDPTTFTYNSVSLTKIASADADTDKRAALYRLFDPATGSNTVQVNWSTAPNNGWMGGCISLTNAVSPVDANNGANGNSTTASVSVTTVANNTWLIDVMFDRAQDKTADGSQVSRVNLDGAFHRIGMSTLGPVTPAGGTTMSWSAVGSGLWGIAAASFEPLEPSLGISVTGPIIISGPIKVTD